MLKKLLNKLFDFVWVNYAGKQYLIVGTLPSEAERQELKQRLGLCPNKS